MVVWAVVYDNLLLVLILSIITGIVAYFWRGGAGLRRALALGLGFLFGGGVSYTFLEMARGKFAPLGITSTIGGRVISEDVSVILPIHAALTDASVILLVLGILILLGCGIYVLINGLRGGPAPGPGPGPGGVVIFGIIRSAGVPIPAAFNPRVVEQGSGTVYPAGAGARYEITGLGRAAYNIMAQADGYADSAITPVDTRRRSFRRSRDRFEQNFNLVPEGVVVDIAAAPANLNINTPSTVTITVRRGGLGLQNIPVDVVESGGDPNTTINGRFGVVNVRTGAGGTQTVNVVRTTAGVSNILATERGSGTNQNNSVDITYANPGAFLLNLAHIADLDEGQTFDIEATAAPAMGAGEDVEAQIVGPGGAVVEAWFNLAPNGARTQFLADRDTTDWVFGQYRVFVRGTRQGVTRTANQTFRVRARNPIITLVDPAYVNTLIPGGQVQVRIEGQSLRGVDVVRLHVGGVFAYRFRGGAFIDNQPPAGGIPRHVILTLRDRDADGRPIVNGIYVVQVVRTAGGQSPNVPTPVGGPVNLLEIDGMAQILRGTVTVRGGGAIPAGSTVQWGALPPVPINVGTGAYEIQIPIVDCGGAGRPIVANLGGGFVQINPPIATNIPVAPPPTGPTVQNIEMAADGVLTGFVQDPAGTRLGAVTIQWDGLPPVVSDPTVGPTLGQYTINVPATRTGPGAPITTTTHPALGWTQTTPVVGVPVVVNAGPTPTNLNIVLTPPAGAITLTGTITERGTAPLAPVAGAVVTCNGVTSAPSNAAGVYQVVGLPGALAGTDQIVTAVAAGFNPYTSPAQGVRMVSPTTTHDFEMVRAAPTPISPNVLKELRIIPEKVKFPVYLTHKNKKQAGCPMWKASFKKKFTMATRWHVKVQLDNPTVNPNIIEIWDPALMYLVLISTKPNHAGGFIEIPPDGTWYRLPNVDSVQHILLNIKHNSAFGRPARGTVLKFTISFSTDGTDATIQPPTSQRPDPANMIELVYP